MGSQEKVFVFVILKFDYNCSDVCPVENTNKVARTRENKKKGYLANKL
jgi:cytochrome oxidase Cu insertion factor (SCO1/SenC/PrrC family)